MSDIFHPTFHVAIPPGAKYFERAGKKIVRFTSKQGRALEGVVLPGGAKCRVETPGYYARIRTRDGRIRRVALGVTDQEAARQLRSKLQREADQEKAGLIDPFERHRRTPLIGTMIELPKRAHRRDRFGRIERFSSDLALEDLAAAIKGSHLADYTMHLKAAGRTQRHVDEVARTVRRVAIACGFEFAGDLDAAVLNVYLSEVMDSGLSRRTRNAALKGLRALTSWMVRSDRLQRDPLRTIPTINEQADPGRRRRRGLTPTEFEKLLACAKGTIEGISGVERAHLYILAVWTGLRRAELGELAISDLSLDSDPPYVHLPAAATKARRDDHPIPLHPYVAEQMKSWLAKRTSHRTPFVFNLKTRTGRLRKTSKMMRLDCEAAGVEYAGDLGVADFHSCRVAFITNLCRTGTDFSTVVDLARHQDPKLTARIYDRVRLENRVAAIGKLDLPTGVH
jgi:integrase